jgi:hypothetical protein
MRNFKGLSQWLQHNYKPKQEVPPQDAQLQGVIKDECKIQQKSLQGQVRNFQWKR